MVAAAYEPCQDLKSESKRRSRLTLCRESTADWPSGILPALLRALNTSSSRRERELGQAQIPMCDSEERDSQRIGRTCIEAYHRTICP